LHAGGNLDFQDFLLIPIGAKSYSESLTITGRVYRELARLLRAHNHEGALVGDEGGFGPRLEFDWQAIEFIVRSIEAAGYKPGVDAALGLDLASTHFYDPATARYRLQTFSYGEGGNLNFLEMVEHVSHWAEHYPIVSIEDGVAEDDWRAWRLLTDRLGGWVQLIGDDLFTTNPERLRRGIA